MKAEVGELGATLEGGLGGLAGQSWFLLAV